MFWGKESKINRKKSGKKVDNKEKKKEEEEEAENVRNVSFMRRRMLVWDKNGQEEDDEAMRTVCFLFLTVGYSVLDLWSFVRFSILGGLIPCKKTVNSDFANMLGRCCNKSI